MDLTHKQREAETPDIAKKLAHSLPYTPAGAPLSNGTDRIIDGSSMPAHNPACAF